MSTTTRHRWHTIDERYTTNADLICVEREISGPDIPTRVRVTVNDATTRDDTMVELDETEVLDIATSLLLALGQVRDRRIARARTELLRVTTYEDAS